MDRLSENSGQRVRQPKIYLPEREDIPQEGNKTCSDIECENSEKHAEQDSNARFPRIACRPTRQRQGKNGERYQQAGFCERCAKLQSPLLPDRPGSSRSPQRPQRYGRFLKRTIHAGFLSWNIFGEWLARDQRPCSESLTIVTWQSGPLIVALVDARSLPPIFSR